MPRKCYWLQQQTKVHILALAWQTTLENCTKSTQYTRAAVHRIRWLQWALHHQIVNCMWACPILLTRVTSKAVWMTPPPKYVWFSTSHIKCFQTCLQLLVINSPVVGNPSCLQTTSASLKSQKSWHTEPQVLLKHTSTLPSSSVRPSTSLTSVLLQTRSKKHKSMHCPYFKSLLLVMKVLLGPLQFISSVPPTQSRKPSHTRDSGMQLPLYILSFPWGQATFPLPQITSVCIQQKV